MTTLRVFLAGYFASMATGALVLGEHQSAAFGAGFALLLLALGMVRK